MNEERISELRALCAEYKKKQAACEAAGLKDKAADIAADSVGRKALEALPELVAELESLREKAYGAYHRGKEKGRAQVNELRQCDLEAKISQLALELEKERAISKRFKARIRELEAQLNTANLKQVSALGPCRIVSNKNSTPPEWLMHRFTEVK